MLSWLNPLNPISSLMSTIKQLRAKPTHLRTCKTKKKFWHSQIWIPLSLWYPVGEHIEGQLCFRDIILVSLPLHYLFITFALSCTTRSFVSWFSGLDRQDNTVCIPLSTDFWNTVRGASILIFLVRALLSSNASVSQGLHSKQNSSNVLCSLRYL